MNDNQFKIRIQIAQSPQAIEQQNSVPGTQAEIDKMPFDWLKILLALLLVSALLGMVSYILFYESNDPAALTKTAPVSDLSAPANDNVMPPGDLQPKITLSEDATGDQGKVSAPSNIITPIHVLPTEAATQTGSNPAANNSVKRKSIVEQDETPVSAIAAIGEDQPQVFRAQLSRRILHREPVDNIDHMALKQGVGERIYFFVQLHNLEGQKITVHWLYQNKEVAKVGLQVGQQIWRTNASKLLTKTRLGAWRVELRDNSGKLLAQRNFTVSTQS